MNRNPPWINSLHQVPPMHTGVLKYIANASTSIKIINAKCMAFITDTIYSP